MLPWRCVLLLHPVFLALGLAVPVQQSSLCQADGTSCLQQREGNGSSTEYLPPPRVTGKALPSAGSNDTFLKFTEIFGSKYPAGSPLFEERYQVFLENLQRYKYLNGFAQTSGEAVYGINQFSDLSAEEFSRIYLRSYAVKKENYIEPNDTFSIEDNLPLQFDWRDKKVVSDVKNQMACGACWAFSIVDTVESDYAIQEHKLVELSVQQVIDCSYLDNGCNGGSTASALKWLQQSHTKLVKSSEYPFKAQTGACHFFPKTDFGVSVKNYKAYDLSNAEELMMTLLTRYGPLAIIVDALSWQDYLGGVIQHHCSSGHSNHAVVLVGYDKSGDIPYWIVKNSWGKSWGIDGYVHIKMGSNLCGVADFVTFPLL